MTTGNQVKKFLSHLPLLTLEILGLGLGFGFSKVDFFAVGGFVVAFVKLLWVLVGV